jgi:hypothetical protein
MTLWESLVGTGLRCHLYSNGSYHEFALLGSIAWVYIQKIENSRILYNTNKNVKNKMAKFA